MARNPTWSRDELILAPDLYMRHRERLPGSDRLEAVELSRALNALYNVFTPSDFTGLIAMSTSCLGLAGSIGEPDTAGRPRLGACATLRHRRGHNDALRLWASEMLERKTVKYKFNLTAVALANKVARIVFVLMTRGGQYDGRPIAA
jgi:hypothetical protein